jgi:hypothetical protein
VDGVSDDSLIKITDLNVDVTVGIGEGSEIAEMTVTRERSCAAQDRDFPDSWAPFIGSLSSAEDCGANLIKRSRS